VANQNDDTNGIQVDQIGEIVPFEDIDADTGIKIRGEANPSGLHGLIQFIDAEDFLVQRVQYRDGKLHGLLERFDKGEKVFEQEFVDGQPHGVMRVFDQNNLVCEQYYANGVQHGDCSIFAAGSLVRQCTYFSGKLHGEVIEYSSGGVVNRKENYNQNLKDGPQYIYWPNGELLQKQHFENGIATSEAIQYSKSGKCVTKSENNEPGILDAIMDLFGGEKK
jgi:antitoxin component YwqK of YwqJK toxin-antitoxin module